MPYRKKKKAYSRRKNYSVINKLLEEERINEKFISDLNFLSLEDIISLKLEIAGKSSGGSIFGIPIWNSLRDICRDAAIKFALSATRTKAEAATFLGIKIDTLKDYIKKYEIEEYFEEKEKKE